MDVRPYSIADREACLAVFDSNDVNPESGSRSEFVAFLDDLSSPYFVMDHDGAIVGCGGFRVDREQKTAELEFGMIRRDAQKQGLGRFLLLYRIREISKAGGIERVLLSALPEMVPFFEKQGFKVDRFSSPDAGHIRMVMKLSVCP